MDSKLKDLTHIYAQVPPDYYEEGKKKNLFQKYWHSRKWANLNKLSEEEPKNILDVGCSSGHILVKFGHKFPKSKLTGVDISTHFINFAKKKYPKINFSLSDAHKLPFKENTFDMVICTETLEHVVDPQKVLREMRRVVSPSGYGLISMDTGSPLFNIVWKIWSGWGPGKVWRGSHIFEFDEKKLERMIKKSGLNITDKNKSVFGMSVTFKVVK